MVQLSLTEGSKQVATGAAHSVRDGLAQAQAGAGGR